MRVHHQRRRLCHLASHHHLLPYHMQLIPHDHHLRLVNTASDSIIYCLPLTVGELMFCYFCSARLYLCNLMLFSIRHRVPTQTPNPQVASVDVPLHQDSATPCATDIRVVPFFIRFDVLAVWKAYDVNCSTVCI